MSFCRFSCMNWQSEIYAYESDRGYMIHIASRRLVASNPDRYEPITHELAGHTFVESSPAEYNARMRELRKEGFTFPDYAFEEESCEENKT